MIHIQINFLVLFFTVINHKINISECKSDIRHHNSNERVCFGSFSIEWCIKAPLRTLVSSHHSVIRKMITLRFSNLNTTKNTSSNSNTSIIRLIVRNSSTEHSTANINFESELKYIHQLARTDGSYRNITTIVLQIFSNQILICKVCILGLINISCIRILGTYV